MFSTGTNIENEHLRTHSLDWDSFYSYSCDKKYKTSSGEIVTTKVCGSLENLVRELLKGAGLNYGSSHSGRRTLATWLDRKGYGLELIQLILGHRNADMTLEYIDPDLPRIKAAFQSIWKGVSPHR